MFDRHDVISGLLEPLREAVTETAKSEVSFNGWVEFAPRSQFVFRLIDDIAARTEVSELSGPRT